MTVNDLRLVVVEGDGNGRLARWPGVVALVENDALGPAGPDLASAWKIPSNSRWPEASR